MLSDTILSQLREQFGVARPKGDGKVDVHCTQCGKRGMGEDGSGKSPDGHLGLNFHKNVAFCVRCGFSVGNLRKWLLRHRIDAGTLDFTAGKSRNFLEDEKTFDAKYVEQVIPLPDGLYPIDESDRRSWPFAESVLDKYLTWQQIKAANLMYADYGRFAGYVWFPFYEDNDLVYWQGRAAWPELDQNPKKRKMNPYENEAPLGKSCWLYGVDDATVGGEAFLCEGALDRITLHDFVQREIGPHAYACSLQGVTMKINDTKRHPLNTQIGKLYCLAPQRICVLFDGPKGPGDRGATEKAEALARELCRCGFHAYAGRLQHGDPNENGDEALRVAIAPPPPSSQQDMRWAEHFVCDL